MAGSSNFQSNITFKGKFDISEILSSIKQMRQQISSTSDVQLLGDLDKQIKKVEDLGSTIQAQIGKGFSSSKEFTSFENNINKLELEFERLGNSFDGINADNLSKALKAVKDDLKDLKKNADDMAKSFADAFKTSASGASGSRATAMKNEIIEAAKAGKSLEEVQERIKNVYEEQLNIQKQTRQELEKRKSQATKDLTSAQGSYANVDLRTTNFRSSETGANVSTDQIRAVREELEKIIPKSNSASEALEKFNKYLQKEGIEAKNAATIQSKVTQAFERYQTSVVPAQTALNDINKALADNSRATVKIEADQQALTSALTTESEKFETAAAAARTHAAASGQVSQKEEELRNSSQQAGQAVGNLRTQMSGAAASLRDGAAATQESINAQKNLNSTLDSLKSRIGYVLSLGNAYYQLRNMIKQTFSDVQKLDSAFASIAMVTDKTVSGLWDTYGDYSKMANELGQSTESAIKASALFYQQGLDTAEALSLTEDTMKLATLAGADFETATEQMTAALRGFHMEMDQGAHVTDVYSELAANAAADVNGIAYAMSKTASIASSAGMDFETTSAFIANMIETTQEAPENIGTAMKTIIARFTELKNNVSAADSEFDDLDYNKVDTALKSVGIQLKDSAGQFRDLDDVFLELSSKWDTLDRNTQRYIATIAAGSRQQSRFIAMMEDYERTMELVEVAQNSAGRSEEQFAKYQDTVEYKLNQLKNSWEQFRTSLIESNAFKEAIDFLTKIINKINQLNKVELAALGASVIILIKNLSKNIIQTINLTIQNVSKIISRGINKLSQTKIGNFFGFVDLAQIDYQINYVKQQITALNAEKITFESDNRDLINDINEAQILLDKYKLSAENIVYGTSKEDGKRYAQIYSNGQRVGAFDITGKESRFQAGLEDYLSINQDINTALKDQNSLEMQRQLAAQRGTIVASAFTSAFSAVIMALADKESDVQTAVKSVLKTMTSTMIPLIVSMGIQAATAASAAGKGIGVAFTTGLASTGVGLIIAAVVTAVSAAIVGFSKYTQKVKEQAKEQMISNSVLGSAARNVEELTKRQEELSESISQANGVLSEQTEKLNQLKKGKELVEEYGKAVALTSEEMANYQEQMNEMADQMPDMVDHYDELGNAILKIGSAWEQAVEEQRQYYQEANVQAKSLEFESSFNELLIAENQKIIAEESQKTVEEYIPAMKGMIENIPIIDAYGADVDWVYDKEGNVFKQSYTVSDFFAQSFQQIGTNTADYLKYGTTQQLDASLVGLLQGTQRTLYTRNDSYGLAAAMQEALENSTLGSSITQAFDPGSLDTFMSDVISYVKKGDINAQGFLDALEEGYEKIENNNGEALIAKYTGDINEARSNANNALSNLFSASLSSEKLYYDASKNVQQVMAEYAASQESLNIDELLEQFKQTEIGQIYYDKEGKKKQGANEEQLARDFSDFVKTSDEFVEAQRSVLALFDEGQQRIIDSLYQRKDFESSNLNSWLSLIKSSDADEQVKTALLNLEQAAIDTYNQDMQAYADALGISLKTNSNNLKYAEEGILKSYGNFTTAQQANFSRMFSSFSTLDRKKGFLSGLNDLGFDDVDLGKIFDLDWSSVTMLNQDVLKEEFIKNLSGDYTEEEKRDLVNALFDFQEEYGQIDIEIRNVDQLKTEVLDPLSEQLDKISGQINAYESVAKSQIEKGYVDYSSLNSLEKALEGTGAKVSDFIDENLQLNRGALEQYLEDMINGELDIIDQNKQEALSRKLVLETMLSQLQGYDSLIAKQITLNSLISDESITNVKQAERIYNQMIDSGVDQYSWITNELDTINEYLEGADDVSESTRLKGIALLASLQETNNTLNETEEKTSKIVDNTEAIEKAQKKVIEAQKKLNELLYGTGYDKSKNDPMYNYKNMLEEVQHQIDRTKDKIENFTTEDMQGSLEDYRKLLEQESAIYQAEKMVYEQSNTNYRQQLTSGISEQIKQLNAIGGYNMDTDISKFYSENIITGQLDIDFDALYSANLNKDIRDLVESTVDEINKGAKQIREIEEAMEKRKTELKEFERKVVDGYVKVEDEVIKVLKEKYQEEIDANKKKNDAMADADSEYLDALEAAIEKQRKLRDRQNQWEDLAQKEKRASLLARDTSGANAVELMDLNKEIDEDREQLLDDTVDDILNNLKEMYDLQKEQRDKQIELQEQSLDEQALIREATDIISGWSSSDDVVAWMIENNKEVANMSDAKLEQQSTDWREYYSQVELYHNYDGSSMQTAIDGNVDQVNTVFTQVSEAQTMEANRVVTETSAKVASNIESAQQSLVEAQKALQKELEKQTSQLETIAINTGGDGGTEESPDDDGEQSQLNYNGVVGQSWIQNLSRSRQQVGIPGSEITKMDAQAAKAGYIWDNDSKSYTSIDDYTQKRVNATKNPPSSAPTVNNVGKSMEENGVVNTIAELRSATGTLNYNQSPLTLNKSLGKQVAPPGLKSVIESQANGTDGYVYRLKQNVPAQGGYRWYDVSKDYKTLQEAQKKYPLRYDGDIEILDNKPLLNGAFTSMFKYWQKYVTGGLVNYTGPAWVDGSPSKPEAFLSADDTQRIGEAAELLSTLPILNSSSASTQVSQIVGDTNIEVHINVENISSDYDVDQAVERVKQDILDAARPQGSSVILRK